MTAGITTVGSRDARTIVGVALLLLVSGGCGRPPPVMEPLVVVVASAPVAAPLERRPIPPSGTHVVDPGETLSEIAYVYRLNTLALARANGLSDVHTVRAGDALHLTWARPASVAIPPRRAAAARAGVPGGEPLRVVVTPIPITPAVVTEGNPHIAEASSQ